MTHFEMELTQRQARQYQRATKKEKGEIITQYCQLTGVSRNLASKRFRKAIRNPLPQVLKVRTQKKLCRKPTYTSIHRVIIQKAWQLSGEICGERLHPVLTEFIDQLQANGELKHHGRKYLRQTRQVSVATLKRVIASFSRVSHKKHKGNACLYKAIPINAHFGKNASRPGYIEIDYVEHNGGRAQGNFACTGTYVDVCLSYLARAAALGKGRTEVERIHCLNEDRIYHPVFEYHPDNAQVVLKMLLERSLGTRKRTYTISRSRPYHKEDNGHVEQKNGDKVRRLVGYHRYDTERQVDLLNQLYQVEDLISNFFVPSQKLLEKVVDEKGRVISRKHEQAKTAYQRLVESGVDEKVKKQVEKIYQRLNLVELRQQSEGLQKQLLDTVVSRT